MNSNSRLARGFSLIEFFLVLAIAVIFLATVNTWLDDYRVRSHIVDALQVAETAKSGIITTCAADGSLQELNNHSVAHNFPHSPFVKSVSISGTCKHPQIAVQTTNTGLFVEPMLVISGDLSGSSASWSCSSTGMQFNMPKRCSGI